MVTTALDVLPGKATITALPDQYRSSDAEVECVPVASKKRVRTPRERRSVSADSGMFTLPHLRARMSAASLAMLEEWDTNPLTPLAERTIRMLCSKYMHIGFCHAAQSQLAHSLGTVRSTLGRGLDELVIENIITIQKRPGTSDRIDLVDGDAVKEALRVQHLERKALEKRMNAGKNRSLTHLNRPKATPKRYLSQVNSCNKSKATKQQHIHVNSAVACLNENEKNTRDRLIENGIAAEQAASLVQEYSLELINERIQAGVHKSKKNPPGFLIASIRENYQQPAPSSETLLDMVSSSVTQDTNAREIQAQTDSKKLEITAELISIGVPPTIASLTASLHSVERIQRQIRSGKHLHAKNPGAFLIAAIRNDYAVSTPIPGSEHEMVLLREEHRTMSAIPTPSNLAVKPLPADAEPMHQQSLIAAQFSRLSEQEQALFEETAHQAIQTNPPFWAVGLLGRDTRNPIIQGLIRTKAIELWQSGAHFTS